MMDKTEMAWGNYLEKEERRAIKKRENLGKMLDTGIYKCTSWYCENDPADSKKTYTEDEICFPFRHTSDVWCYECAEGLG